MGLKELFNKPALPDREPALRDRSAILAYLEELCRLRTGVVLWLNKENLLPVGAKVDLVGEDTGTFTLSLQRSLPGDLDTRFPFEMLFPMDGMRFRCPVRFKERGGYMKGVFALPECIMHAERREKIRTRFNQRESAHVTVLENLFHGHAASGKLINLSLEGLCMRIERAISVGDDKRLALGSSLFHARQELMVVRIQDLPHMAMIECSGTVMHIEDSSEGLMMGLLLNGLGSSEAQGLYQLMSRRVPTFARGFPQKRRRCEFDLEKAGQPDASTTPEAPAEASETVEPAPAEPGEAFDPVNRLERLRKRSRRILLIQRDDLDRTTLAGKLMADGFSHIREAQTFADAFQITHESPMDLIFIEQNSDQIPVQAFLERLRKLGHCEDVPVILLASLIDVKTTIMAKATHIAHVQKCPIDYEDELRPVLYRLLRI